MTSDDGGEASVFDGVGRAVRRRAVRLATKYGADRLGGVHRAYWRLRLAVLGEDGTVQVGGTTARFGVDTRSERRRVQQLGGERFVLEALLDELTGTETVWDVGACVGTYACFAALRLPEGRVVAFEPEPTNRDRLRENLCANAPRERWRIASAALSDRDGVTELASEFVEVGGGHHYLSEDGGRPVQVRRGDSLVSDRYPAPDVLKIDVQGAELDVLCGMGDALEHVDVIYAELHPEKSLRFGSTAEEVEAFLREAGYSVEQLGEPTTGRPGVYFVRAHR